MAERWSVPMHAVAMLTAFGVAAVFGRPLPLVLGACCSLFGLAAGAAGRWTPAGGFGPANLVTAIRVFLVLAGMAAAQALALPVLLALLLAALLLDGVDGWLARRLRCCSRFGALFDVEADALFILVLGFLAWQQRGVVAWVLVPGLLRYAYVVVLALVPPALRDERRSSFARVAFVLTASLLLLALALGGSAGAIPAVAATAVACLSFGRSFAEVYPQARAAPQAGAPGWLRAWRFLRAPLLLLAVWSFLDVVANVRFPDSEPGGWYFLPSVDVTILLAGFALAGLAGRRIPVLVRASLLPLFLLIRLFRLGDGVTRQLFSRHFNFYIDIPMLPELVRYLHSTVAAWKFYLDAAAVLAALGLFIGLVDRALVLAANLLRARRQQALFAGVALGFALASTFVHNDPRYNKRYAGAFGDSAFPRLASQATFLFNVFDRRASENRAIASVEQVVRHAPSGLERLDHANVFLIFVESYGATALRRPALARLVLPELDHVRGDLSGHGFAMASGLLDSATYGGGSWLAHATLLTGFRTGNQLQYDLLRVSRPRTLAQIFHEDGYHTILVEPNTTRRTHATRFYGFDETYDNWNFDYAGPPFAWATMPDQYVLDFIRRRVLATRRGPLFVSYVLVSSHAPWSRVPTLVPDWSRVGNGAIFNGYPFHHADLNWPDFANASLPYARAIVYDLRVLDSYLGKFVHDRSLFIILGDHQPVTELTHDSLSWAVPVHIVSRDPALVAPFLKRGYAAGMVPGPTSRPMERFLVDFLDDFSGGSS